MTKVGSADGSDRLSPPALVGGVLPFASSTPSGGHPNRNRLTGFGRLREQAGSWWPPPPSPACGWKQRCCTENFSEADRGMSEHGSRRAGGGGSRGGGRRSANAGGIGDKLDGLAGQLSGVFGKRRGGQGSRRGGADQGSEDFYGRGDDRSYDDSYGAPQGDDHFGDEPAEVGSGGGRRGGGRSG